MKMRKYVKISAPLVIVNLMDICYNTLRFYQSEIRSAVWMPDAAGYGSAWEKRIRGNAEA